MIQESSSSNTAPRNGLPSSIQERLERDNVKFFQQVPLFHGLPDDQLSQLASVTETHHFNRNDVIIHQGQPNNHIYFIRDGLVGVTVKDEDGESEKVVSYFHQNHIFGEFGLFSSEQHIATANVTALTEVNLVRMLHNDFTDTLNDYHPAAMEVARILTQRLQAPTDKIIPVPEEHSIYLIMGLNKGAGATTVGSALAAALGKREDSSVVYTEFPDGTRLPETFGYASTEFYSHAEGYDIFVPRGMPRLVPAVHLELIFERLQKKYKTIVISIPSKHIYDIADLLERIDHIALVSSPARWESLGEVNDLLRGSAYVKEASITKIANYCYPEYASYPKPEDANFSIPFLVAMNLAKQSVEGIPEKLSNIATELADRLEGQNEMRVYIPKISYLPNGEEANNAPAMEKLMWIMRDAFGEVHREEVEDEHIVISSYASVEDVNEKWQHIIQQVYQIKSAIHQEKLALEINHNLVIV